MAGIIDPTVTGKYPVILGDGLMGRTSNDIFTGVRFNHKPELSSGTVHPETARIRPSVQGKAASYDFFFYDNGGRYGYEGKRNTKSDQHVLYFDPEKQAFILDKIDSTFDMNLTKTPTNDNPASLASRFPHLNSGGPHRYGSIVKEAKGKSTSLLSSDRSKLKTKARARSPLRARDVPRNPEKKSKPEPAKDKTLALPEVAKPKPPKARPKDEEDEDEEDDDGGLLVEYPGAAEPKAKKAADFSPAFHSVNRFDDFMDQRESEADDADGESDDEMEQDFKLPSPVNNRTSQPSNKTREPEPEPEPAAAAVAHNSDDDEDHDMASSDINAGGDLDLEKDLMDAFATEAGNIDGESPPLARVASGDGEESEISEED